MRRGRGFPPAGVQFLRFLALGCLLSGRAYGGTMEGSVLDARTRQPIAGAAVFSGTEETLTGDDGRFHIEDHETLAVLAPGYLPTKVKTSPSPAISLTPFTPRALYLTSRGVGDASLRQRAMQLIAEDKANALVIDVKDDYGNVVYPSRAALAEAVGARSLTTIPDLGAFVRSMHDHRIYVIARIVVFKDDQLASHRTDLAVMSGAAVHRDREHMAWADPFRRAVWRYNTEIAREAAEAGFDEVQFDYVRFPDSQSPLQFAQPPSEDARVAAITGFLTEARRVLAPRGVFTAADFFGYVCWNSTDTGIGQQLSSISGAVDYLSPMLYPSGFHAGIPGYPNPVADTYQVVRLSLERARARLGIPSVRFRPWLQAFRDYAFDHRAFDEAQIKQQIRAAADFGADGWMLWNARNRYDMLEGPDVPIASGCPVDVDGRTG